MEIAPPSAAVLFMNVESVSVIDAQLLIAPPRPAAVLFVNVAFMIFAVQPSMFNAPAVLFALLSLNSVLVQFRVKLHEGLDETNIAPSDRA